MRLTSLAALLLLMFSLSCGGRASHPAAQNGPAVPIQLTGLNLHDLPALPSHDTFNPQRVSSSAAASLLGYATNNTQGTSIANTSLELDSQASQVSYAVYDFAATPGEVITQLGLAGHGGQPGSKVYAGISDYANGVWDFFQPQTGAGTFPLTNGPGKYVSPGGHVYVIAATFNSTFYTVDSVTLTCSDRFSVTGTVLDGASNPIQGAVVGTPLGQQAAVTDANGNYTLALPNGSWPVMVTDDSWTFYSNPSVVTVNSAPLTGVNFSGRQHNSHYLPNETGPFNNTASTAEPADFSSGPVSATLSRIDDPTDFYSFTVTTPGVYYLEFTNPDMDIYFPDLQLMTPSNFQLAASATVYRGATRIPVLVGQAPQTMLVSVDCIGGGGNYTLALGSGPLQKLAGTTVPSLLDCVVTAHNTVSGDDTE